MNRVSGLAGRAARTFLVSFLVSILAASSGGCGAGGVRRAFLGTLQVCNHPNSNFTITEIDVAPISGGIPVVSVVSLDANECETMELLSGNYRVDVFYDDATSETTNVEIVQDHTTTETFQH